MAFAAVSVFGLSIGGGVGRIVVHKRPAAQTADDVDLEASCGGNAALATSGRAALCFAPWVADVDSCLDAAQISLWIDLSSCQARNDPATAITMIETKPTQRIAQIDPEKLLEEMLHEDKTKPPSPPKPELKLAAEPPPPPSPPPQSRLPQQVVDTVKPKEEKEPDPDTRLLSEYNTKVDKQKVARGAAKEQMVAKPEPEMLTTKAEPKAEPSIKQQLPDRAPGTSPQAPDVPGKLSMRAPGALSPSTKEQEAKTRGSVGGAMGVAMNDGYQQRRGDAALEQQRQERSEIPRGQNGAGGGAPPADLKLSNEVLERTVGGGSVDRLDDVENGDETLLSSKRWIYAGFFNRVKHQLMQNWEAGMVMAKVDPTGSVYGGKSRTTSLKVILSRTGQLIKIIVVSPSGVSALDEEATRAFRASAPFLNPPEALVKDNAIVFAFSLTVDRGEPAALSWRLPTAM